MSVNAVVAKGTLFKRGDGSSIESFAALAEMNSIGLPNQTRPMIDVTDLDSLAREFVPGLLDAGQVVINMNFTRDTYIDMKADLGNDDSVNYQIVFPDAGETTIDFAGYAQEMSGEAPGPDERISVDVTFKITGDITITS